MANVSVNSWTIGLLKDYMKIKWDYSSEMPVI